MKTLPFALSILALASCTVGPNHVKPDVSDITPAKWKWKSAEPRDEAPKGEWWTVFKDRELNRFEALAVANNNDLRAAMARLDQAMATIRVSSAALSPQVNGALAAQRERTSGNPPSPVPIAIPSAQINSFNVPLQLSYELDLWGRIRRSIESARAQAEGTTADYQTVLLSLTGEVASVYFQLCALDAELAALQRTLDSREKSTGIIEQRFKAGVLPEVDAARARSELATTKAEIADVKRQREELVSGLALLCGQPASTFTVAARTVSDHVPTIPSGIPSSLLERRPDIASAERKVASRSAQIGAEVAGYFPAISLTGQGGYLSKDTSSLFTADTRVWSFGPSVSVPVTGLFITKAKVERAKSAHQESIADYRQAVLTAIKDVETSLTQIHYRQEQMTAQGDAVTAAQRATELVRSRYEGGTVSYLELLDAERTSLALERQTSQIKAQRLIATVRLIKALGGRW
ncbi:MAG: efflux transporter outer membrane subunit [Verrucomicrobiaceae bacterium]|nr:efflux transporter outer membrane subunit [Verrucomicrobiaceae bacterium]